MLLPSMGAHCRRDFVRAVGTFVNVVSTGKPSAGTLRAARTFVNVVSLRPSAGILFCSINIPL